jgi:hypothetical protein
MVKTIIMTSVRATGPGAGPSMLNVGAADIVRGHMVVHDLGGHRSPRLYKLGGSFKLKDSDGERTSRVAPE